MAEGSTAGLRRKNRGDVLRLLAEAGAVSRSELAQATGLTGAAVSRITRELIDVGLVVEKGAVRVKGQVGRRNVQLMLGPDGAYILGISLSANVQTLTIGNSQGKIIHSQKIEGLPLNDPQETVRQLCEVAAQFISKTGIERRKLLGCGVVVGGVADSEKGVLVRSDPLGWKNVPLGQYFGQYLDIPVKVEGRAVAILMAETRFGVAKGLKNVVLISNGLTIGGAIMLDGSIPKGHANMVGQIGHFALPGETVPCACGRIGCLDALCSGSAILAQIAEKSPDLARERLAKMVAAGPDDSRKIFSTAGGKMGLAIDAVAAMLDPEMVLLTGDTHKHPDFIAAAKAALQKLRPNLPASFIGVGEVSVDQSAINLGMNVFVFSNALPIENLLSVVPEK